MLLRIKTIYWTFLFFIFLLDNSVSITNTGVKIDTGILDGSIIVISLENCSVSNSEGISVDSFHKLPPYSMSRVVLTKIPSDVHFVVMQVHSYLVDVILSLDERPLPKNSITGANIGLVKIYQKSDLTFYISYNSSSNEGDIMVTVQAYSKDAPIPGGCNMEFPVEISPFLLTNHNNATIEVSFAPSAPALAFSQQSPAFKNNECNIKPSPVKHKMYHRYFPERDFTRDTYFTFLKSMMTKGQVLKNAVPVPEKVTSPPLKRLFATYPGTGNAFVVVSQFENYTSVYVPSFTYGCGDLKDINTCDVLTTTFSKVLCATLLFMGLFTCYFGHYFFRIEIFLFGFLTSGIVSYVLVSILFTNAIALSSAVSIGLIAATLMLYAWTIFGVPIISVILTTLTFGFLLASIIYYSIIDYVNLLVFDINFWGIFIGIVLSCPILMLCLAEKANIFSCAFLGSYIGILSIDHYIGSNLRYIVINTIRRATDKEFKLAVIAPPFQMKDALLCTLWALLMLTGIKVQRLLMKNKPPYPPPLNPFNKLFQTVKEQLPFYQPNERTPLLIDLPPNIVPSHSPYEILRSRIAEGQVSNVSVKRNFRNDITVI